MAILVEHNREWHELYKAQAKLIKKALRKACVATEHIGSTAIPGVPSRPVVDILVLIKDPDAAMQLCTLGYKDNGNGTYLLQGNDVSYLAYCVHINDHDTIDTHMGLLNHFRASKKISWEWAEQKKAWAEQFKDDPQSYEEAKQTYFEQIAPAVREKNRQDQKLGSSIAIGMCLGMGIGTALGAAFDNIGIGMCIGISIGMCLGVALGSHQNKSNDKE